MRLITSGKTFKKIAQEMCLSQKTIFKIRLSIKKKMAMKNNREIIMLSAKDWWNETDITFSRKRAQ